MSEYVYVWQPIETAPKDTPLLLFGLPDSSDYVTWVELTIISGYWDTVEGAWCSTTADWTGPFINATHWMSLPDPPRKNG